MLKKAKTRRSFNHPSMRSIVTNGGQPRYNDEELAAARKALADTGTTVAVFDTGAPA